MAEQTQTEKLRETFLKIVLGNKFSFELADELVKASKEAGLKFVPGEWSLKQDEERYAFTPEFNRRDINSQIGEIEI